MANADNKPSRVDAYHEQFAEKLITAIEAGTAPWQQPWAPGEQISPQNFSSSRDYRGGNAIYLAVAAVEKGYTDPRWGGYRQIAEAGGHVRKGEKGTPIMYVEYHSRTLETDEQGQPKRDADGHPAYRVEPRDRPMVRIHTVFNVEQTEGLNLPPLGKRDAPEWEAHTRVEAVMRGSDVTIKHVPGDKACYRPSTDEVVLPPHEQFPTQAGYSHTALHELGHATGHESRLNRPTLMKHEGFGSETYAREELRAEMTAMMAGERLGVGHEPRHGTAYVASWIKALQNDPREIRRAAVDAQKAADWLVTRERTMEREPTIDQGEAGRKDAARPPPPDLSPELSGTPERPAPGPDMDRDFGPSL